ncbi:hypothetical protein SAMN05518801_104243 [Novosphingobium sp. CF614]|uniref:hypothetical protein n=1 Tax=Novosphingobium sp. CF614 TaxID=1884364 RepID=UPI0008F2E7CE|nr:hypothetical protein [Novosphingobium sp. CF614]SFF96990.1 hypothetical protein SAMN05518801_104243 [Novosphingobium sp. CF614]
MPFTRNETDRGPVFTANGAPVHIPNSEIMAPLVPVLDAFTRRATEVETVMKPEAAPARIAREAGPLLAASKSALNAALADARATAEADARALTPPPTIADAAKVNGPEIRAAFRQGGIGGKMGKIASASAVELAAILEPGNLAELPPQAVELARERALPLYHIERAGLNASAPRKPSLARLLAVGPDAPAVQAEAELAGAYHRGRLDAVEANESVLQHLVGYLAAALHITADDALARVLAA